MTLDDKPVADFSTYQRGQKIGFKCTLTSIPVRGDESVDETDPTAFVKGGDTLTVPFPAELKFSNTATQIAKTKDGTTVAAVNFSGNSAVLTFDTELDDESVQKVSASFDAWLKLDESGIGDEGGDIILTILEKDVTIHVPPKPVVPVEIQGNKSGTADVKNGVIDWKVKVDATQEGTPVTLGGMQFEDKIAEGEYQPGTFKYGKSSDGTGATVVTPDPYDSSSKTLSYTLPEDIDEGPVYIFFQTSIPDNKLYTDTEQRISNTAHVTRGAVGKDLTGSASVTVQWIRKDGAVVEDSEGTGGTYDPSNRQIKWTIEANQNFAPIENAYIKDDLMAGLEYASGSAKIQYRSPNGEWEPTPAAIFPSQTGESLATSGGLRFDLGDNLSGKQVRITFVTDVTDKTPPGTVKDYTNKAYLHGTGIGAGGLGSNQATVGIGMNPISKSAITYSTTAHAITWDVKVDTKNQVYGGNLRVLDLLVYGTGSFDWSSITAASSNPATTTSLAALTLDQIKALQLTQQYNQKYIDGTFKDLNHTGLELTIYTLKAGGEAVADLLVVTEADGEALNHQKVHEFSYKSLITNPNIYASNKSNTLYNTAALFSGTDSKATITGNKQVSSNMLKKNASEFNYLDKTADFTITVNENGLTDATNDVTNTDGLTLGSLTVKDTLPKDWEFKRMSGAEDDPKDVKDFFEIRNASGQKVQDYSDFLAYSAIQPGTASDGESIVLPLRS